MIFQSIDWAGAGALLGGIGSIVSGIGSLVAAVALVMTYRKARNSLDEWRAQEQFKEDRKLAIEALAAFEEGKQAIESIRSPLSLANEQAGVDRRLREAEEQQQIALDESARSKQMKRLTVQLRIEDKLETWRRLIALLPVTKAVFGEPVSRLLLEILKARQEVSSAADMFTFELNPASIERFHKIIWSIALPGEADPINPRLEDAERKLSHLLTPFIRPNRSSSP